VGDGGVGVEQLVDAVAAVRPHDAQPQPNGSDHRWVAGRRGTHPGVPSVDFDLLFGRAAALRPMQGSENDRNSKQRVQWFQSGYSAMVESRVYGAAGGLEREAKTLAGQRSVLISRKGIKHLTPCGGNEDSGQNTGIWKPYILYQQALARTPIQP